MSTTSGTQVLYDAGGVAGRVVTANGNPYTTDAQGTLQNAAQADVAALLSQGFVITAPEVTDNPVPNGQYGNG